MCLINSSTWLLVKVGQSTEPHLLWIKVGRLWNHTYQFRELRDERQGWSVSVHGVISFSNILSYGELDLSQRVAVTDFTSKVAHVRACVCV